MKQFSEVIRILDRFREPRTETIDTGFRSRKQDKDFQLYDGIRQGVFLNDAIAAQSLYQTSPADTRYSTLKSRLKNRMLNSLFHLDLKRAGYSEYAQAIYVCRKKVYYAHILIALGARNAGTRMAERALDLSRRYHFLDITIEMALHLRTHAGIIGKTAMYDDYDRILKKTLHSFEAECTSWEYFDRAQSILARHSGGQRVFSDQFKTYVSELHDLLDEDSSYTFRLNYYRLRIFALSAMGDLRELVIVCDEALSYLRSLPHLTPNARLGEFSFKKFESYVLAQEYGLAAEAATDVTALFEYGSNNWLYFAQSYFLLLMNTLDFARAYEFYTEVTTHARFPLQPEASLERWRIYELYLHFALRRTSGYETMEFRKRFDLARLLNMSPVAAKDKHGLNVALLIAHVLYMLDAGDFRGINDRMEALTTYRVRYLRVTDNPRTHLFFKLLRVMENTSFTYERALELGDKYYQELRVLKPKIIHAEEELQIVPYAWLWQRILEKLREFKAKK